MNNPEKRIQAFIQLGEMIREVAAGKPVQSFNGRNFEPEIKQIGQLILNSQAYNGWFTEKNVRYMLVSIGESLREAKLRKWIGLYHDKIERNETKTIAVVMAGNIPAVGFHDFLTVLISGNKILARLSTDDNKLIPAMADLLCKIEPDFKESINFTDNPLAGFDAVIATGSNNTSRYFDYYFGRYPNLIRKNRNGIAVLTGDENEEELHQLGKDIFTYYGLGCRNVSKLLVPDGYEFDKMLDIFAKYIEVNENHKYFNNYEYNKAIYLVNGTTHLDTGNLLLKEDFGIASPVSVVYYQKSSNEKVLLDYVAANKQNIQCVVTGADFIKNNVPFGKSQEPELWDYADGVDTMEFILSPGRQ